MSFTYRLEKNSRVLLCSQNVAALRAQAAQILECRMETGNMGKCYPCPRNWLWNFFTCSCSYYDIYPVCCTKFLQVSSGKMAVIWQMSKQKNKTRNVYTSHKSLKNALIHPTDGSKNIRGRQTGFCMPKEFKPWKTIREESSKLPGEAHVGRVTMMWSISRTIQTTVRGELTLQAQCALPIKAESCLTCLWTHRVQWSRNDQTLKKAWSVTG